MKKTKFIIPLAAAFLLVGCAGEGGASSASSSASSSSSSSSSSVDDGAKKALTIADLESKAASFTDKKSAVAGGTISYVYKTVTGTTSKVITYQYGSDSNGDAAYITDSHAEKTYNVITNAAGDLVTVEGTSYSDYIYSEKQFEEAAPYIDAYLGNASEAYGAEGFFTDVVSKAKKDSHFSAYSENGITYLSFTYYEGDDPKEADYAYFANVSVFSDASGAIFSLSFDATSYDKSQCLYDSVNDKFVVAKGKVGETLSYTINQNIKARTYTNDIDLDDFIYTSFDLYYEDGWDEDTGDVIYKEVTADTTFDRKVGDLITLNIDADPETGNNSFDPFTLTVVSGGDSDAFDTTNAYIKGYDNEKDTYEFECLKAGTYEVKLSTKNCTSATFKITVSEPAPSDVYVGCYNGYLGYNYSPTTDKGDDEGTKVAYVGSPYYLYPEVAGDSGVSQNVTVEVKYNGSKASEDSYSISETDMYSEFDDYPNVAYQFVPKKAGIYLVTFASAVDQTVKKVVRFEASEINVAKDILGKKYTYVNYLTDTTYSFDFTPDSTDSLKGKATVTSVKVSMNVDGDEKTVTKSETVNYELAKNDTAPFWGYDFSFTHVSGDTGVVTHTKDGDDTGFNSMNIDKYNGVWVKVGSDDSFERLQVVVDPEEEISKKWSGNGKDEEGESTDDMLELTFSKADHSAKGGIYSDEPYDSDLDCTWSIAENDDGDGYILTLTKKEDSEDNWGEMFSKDSVECVVTSDFSSITVTTDGSVYDGYTYEIDSNF